MSDSKQELALADDVLGLAEKLGFVCPPLALGAAITKTLVDAGFALYFRRAMVSLGEQRAAQVSGVAAAEAQAVTSALQHERETKRICPPCADAFAEILATAVHGE